MSLLVLGDSLSFHGPRTAHPVDEPRLWPHVAASSLATTADLHVGLGWTARHAWTAVRTDPRVWASVRTADALVLGIGGMDSLPSPLPTAVRELIPVLRPPAVAARARRLYRSRHAGLVRATGGRPTALAPAETVRCLERIRVAVTTLRPHAPVVLLLPSVHRSGLYGGVHSGRSAHVAAMRSWASAHGVRALEVAPLVTEHVLGGHGNPDGIHWGWSAHRVVGEAVAELLRPAEPVVPSGSSSGVVPRARC
ncbi:diglucosylglycerate octanoyltransferase [Actinomycetospora termitidis]|uniref:SGNH/GDSL hydrolase family protein n=1 Tax=Actinomycetospora termitidis TaxID=3053470 RepID=A0ABT7MH67_9PSEU|nr:diglucosylglycerate octanoyltransferase [Actinomycetospora sp. Odt1-22]MDL5160030.1 SGNH/GDSL hydrolase family protein [Actinomycetospora sp. Odt1-22]